MNYFLILILIFLINSFFLCPIICRTIHNDPETVEKYESIVGGEKFRSKLLKLVGPGGELPNEGEHIFRLFSDMIQDAHIATQEQELKLQNQLQDHANVIQHKNSSIPSSLSSSSSSSSSDFGPALMRRKSGELLDMVSKGKIVQESRSASIASQDMMDSLSSGKTIDKSVIQEMTSPAYAVKQSAEMGTADEGSIKVMNNKGHISKEIKALAGVPRLPHVNMQDVYNLAVDSLPKDIHKELTHRRMEARISKLAKQGEEEGKEEGKEEEAEGKEGKGEQEEGKEKQEKKEKEKKEKEEEEEPLPFGAKKLSSSLSDLESASAFSYHPGIVLPNDKKKTFSEETKEKIIDHTKNEVQAHEKVLRSVIGKQHSEILSLQEKHGTHLSTLTLLDNLHGRLVNAKEDVMDEIFHRMNHRAKQWEDQGINDLKTMKLKANQLKTESHQNWKTLVLKAKLLKAQNLFGKRKEL